MGGGVIPSPFVPWGGGYRLEGTLFLLFKVESCGGHETEPPLFFLEVPELGPPPLVPFRGGKSLKLEPSFGPELLSAKWAQRQQLLSPALLHSRRSVVP